MVLEFSFGGDQVALAIEMLIMYSEADLWRFEVKNQFEKYSYWLLQYDWNIVIYNNWIDQQH